MVSIFGDDQEVFSQKLMPMLEAFCRDPDDEVRSTIASGFHEILAYRVNNGTATDSRQAQATTMPEQKSSMTATAAGKNAVITPQQQQQQQPHLLNPFVELLSSGSSEVVQQLTGNLQKILPVLYSEINTAASTNGKRQQKSVSELNK